MDRLTSYSVFLKSLELGSFSAAARELGMSPQMAGRHIDALEKALEARLINRSTRQLGLTEAGRIFAAGAKRAMEAVEAAAASVHALADVPRGTLRISLPSTLGYCRIVPELGGFCEAYPEISLDISLTDRFVDPIGEALDVCLRIGDLKDSELAMRRLPNYQLGAFAAPSYLEKFGAPSHPTELLSHQCLSYAYQTYPAPNLWVFPDKNDPVELNIPAKISIDDTTALVALALRGEGIVMTGEINVIDHIKSGRLVHVFPHRPGLERQMSILFHRHRDLAPKQRVFIDWLVKLIA